MTTIPLLKLATLLVRTASKPIANQVKATAKTHEGFRRFCINTGQAINSITSRVNVYMMGHRITNIKPLEEEVAATRGAEFMGEVVIYSISAATIIFEVSRQANNSKIAQAQKDERHRLKQVENEYRWENMKKNVSQIEITIKDLQDDIADLHQQIDVISKTKSSIFTQLAPHSQGTQIQKSKAESSNSSTTKNKIMDVEIPPEIE